MEKQRKGWYVAFTKPRSEDTAKYYLKIKGIEAFCPKLLLPGDAPSGRHIVPLFPNYMFIRMDISASEYYQVIWCRGIKKLIAFGGVPSVLNDDFVEFLRDQGDSEGVIVARTNLKPGDEAQIIRGPFRGLAGIIKEPPDSKSRVKVLVAILSRQVQLDVPATYLEAGWLAPCQI